MSGASHGEVPCHKWREANVGTRDLQCYFPSRLALDKMFSSFADHVGKENRAIPRLIDFFFPQIDASSPARAISASEELASILWTFLMTLVPT